MSQEQRPAPVLESEDDILAYTHRQRKEIVKAIVKDGKVPVDDSKQLGALIQTLDGMSRDALTRKRIGVEEKSAQSQEANTAIMAQLLQSVTSQKPFQRDVTDVTPRAAPALPDSVPPPQTVEGETATAAPQLSYDTFVQQSSPMGGERV